ncbi:NAD(P)H-dependent glycerol-3-phosphate dehydrogenase [Paracoccus sp. p4-l81]|uniref:NAD(P)H-dependent glycerol-3-phosphate dehydrogenase n=1 Tax=unclassified Paracoccus (in: a-proteobacteria) TaxID=2688777 RepID=UPI0035B743D6
MTAQIAVLGAGAFGTALAITLAARQPVTLWARDAEVARVMQASRVNARRLPGALFPDALQVTGDLSRALQARVVLLAMPMQQIGGFVGLHHADLAGKNIVACAKGIDLSTGTGPAALLSRVAGAVPAILTGPSFAADIARGLPTALTLACADPDRGEALQAALSTPVLRLYRTTDTVGAELGGALKNVVAIAAGVTIGAGLGESARAATVTRGFAEITRLATALGARPDTLMGLSGLGDLVLTCTSGQSRNFQAGQALGAGLPLPQATTEGLATAAATLPLAARHGVEMPLTAMVAALAAGRISTENAIAALLARPLKEE